MTHSFSRRMWAAIRFIESGAEHVRQLDDAFENFDGEAMATALYKMSFKRPALAANYDRYIRKPSEQVKADAERLTMAQIRAIAKQQREEGAAETDRMIERARARRIEEKAASLSTGGAS